jgi:hypothetical protein
VFVSLATMSTNEQLAQIENLRKMIEQSENALQRVRATLDELEIRLQAGEIIDLNVMEAEMSAVSHRERARSTASTHRDKSEPFSPATLADTVLAGS